jgi:F-type H+-transporting ATPase subunit b
VITMFATTESATQSASGIASLGLDLKTFIFQLIAFIIVLWILNKFAVKKILAVMDKRQAVLNKGLKEAEDAKKELQNANAQSDKILQAARVQADSILADAQSESMQIVKNVEEKAADRAERIIKEASEQLDQDVQKAREALKQETAQLVTRVAEVVLQDKLTDQKDGELIARSIQGSKL